MKKRCCAYLVMLLIAFFSSHISDSTLQFSYKAAANTDADAAGKISRVLKAQTNDKNVSVIVMTQTTA